MVCQTKPRIKIGFLWQIICSFYITSHLLPLFPFVCHTLLACKPFNSALHISTACRDGDLTWIMPWTAYTVLITLIIIDLTGLWSNLWRNTFASHYSLSPVEFCMCLQRLEGLEGAHAAPGGLLGSGEGHRPSLWHSCSTRTRFQQICSRMFWMSPSGRCSWCGTAEAPAHEGTQAG